VKLPPATRPCRLGRGSAGADRRVGVVVQPPGAEGTFGLMMRGLLADVPKKNSWGLAERVGLATPQPLEHLLGGARFDDGLRITRTCWRRRACRSASATSAGSPDQADRVPARWPTRSPQRRRTGPWR
jgi:hypothetical protein